MDMEAEQVGPSAPPSFSNSKILNLNLRQDDTSIVQPAEKLEKVDKIHPLSLEPFPNKHACDFHKIYESGKDVVDEFSIVGRSKHSTIEAHEVTSPLKSFKKPPINLETTNTPLSPKRGNWKRIAEAQGKKSQDVDPQTQNVSRLSGIKRLGRLDFMDEEEGKP